MCGYPLPDNLKLLDCEAPLCDSCEEEQAAILIGRLSLCPDCWDGFRELQRSKGVEVCDHTIAELGCYSVFGSFKPPPRPIEPDPVDEYFDEPGGGWDQACERADLARKREKGE
jgi:hypothetical protein